MPGWLQTGAAWSWRLLLLAAAIYLIVRVLGILYIIVVPCIVALLLTALLQPLTARLRRAGLPALAATWITLLIVAATGRCPSCAARVGPYPLLAELAAGLALAVVAARASSVWKLAVLAWLVLLALIDMAVRRLPDPLIAAAFAGTIALLAVAALTGHQPGYLGRAAIGAVALAALYLVLSVITSGGLGLGNAKLAASVGAALGWISWQALLCGTFAAFALAGVYGGALLALHRATRTSQLPLGPFILLGALAAIAL